MSAGLTRRSTLVVLVVTCVALLLAWATKGRCLLDGGWQGAEQYLGWCYTDVYPLYFAEQLHEGATPYVDHPVEYPVLTGLQMWLTAGLVRLLDLRPAAVWFFHLTALLGGAALLSMVVALRTEGVPVRRLLWLVLAPTFVVYAFMNWDALPVALLVAALALHRRGQDAAAGVAAGLGAAAKLFPGIVVPVVVAVRIAQRRPRAALVHAAAALGVWLLLNLPFMITAYDGWQRFLELNRTRPADWDSLWFLLERLRGVDFEAAWVNAASFVVFLVGALVIAWLGARPREPERWWELTLPLLAWFLLANKVYSPQFSLWLLPLLVLALPRGGPLAVFVVADLFVFVVRFPFLGGVAGIEPALGYPWLGAAIALRAVALLWVITRTVRDPAPVLVSERVRLRGA